MTIVELLVASFISLGVVAMSVALTMATREIYFYDTTRVELAQNLRGALHVIGIDVREGGERLNGSFPAIEIANNANGTTDQLLLRRNLIDEVLVVCETITAGSGTTSLILNKTGSAVAACTYGAQASNVTRWADYRTEKGGTVLIYIFDQTTKLGEFLRYNAELDNGSTASLQTTGHTFTNTYTGGAAALYIIEQRRYFLDTTDGTLQMIEDDKDDSPYNVVYGVTDFQIVAHMQDGTTKNDLLITDDWTQVQDIESTITGKLEVTGKAGTYGRALIRTLTARHFPRNILSN